ncbi:MAG: hypothetical protein IAF38_06665 [Bacteroidia bacterium]|nr:hypothetical protein [Bacteroidia bacterium]
MKKLITLCLIATIAGIVFSSCTTGNSVIKRHYNNGYYFAHSKGKSVHEKQKEKMLVSEIKEPFTFTMEQTVAVNEQPVQNSLNPVSVVLPPAEKSENKAVSKKEPVRELKHESKTITERATISATKVSGKDMSGSTAERDALSLFWVVILIIIILWAFGFAFGGWGLGPLINLLLLIALILLILWLLRVI